VLKVVIIGEVRCGTTSLADHLKSLPGASGPFCAFKHPLDGKESFYFSGHYFGIVHPYFYRAMFPLKFWRWWNTKVLGKPYFVLDACAQYLTSPVAPQLVAAACGPDLPIIVCLREPVSQNVSWWRFEHGTVGWGDSMGLPASGEGIPETRVNYPPKSVVEAHSLSLSPEVSALYTQAEGLVPGVLDGSAVRLPPWAITWPNGQLSAAGRNGVFADNIVRWQKSFAKSNFEYVEVTELSNNLPNVLTRVRAMLPSSYTGAFNEARKGNVVKLNGAQPLDAALEPSQADKDNLKAFYKPHNERLFELIGKRYKHW